MTIKELLLKLQAMNPDAEVHQIYDGMVKPIRVAPADSSELAEINMARKIEDPEAKDLSFAVVFWSG